MGLSPPSDIETPKPCAHHCSLVQREGLVRYMGKNGGGNSPDFRTLNKAKVSAPCRPLRNGVSHACHRVHPQGWSCQLGPKASNGAPQPKNKTAICNFLGLKENYHSKRCRRRAHLLNKHAWTRLGPAANNSCAWLGKVTRATAATAALQEAEHQICTDTHTHTAGDKRNFKPSSCFFTSVPALTKYLPCVYTE